MNYPRPVSESVHNPAFPLFFTPSPAFFVTLTAALAITVFAALPLPAESVKFSDNLVFNDYYAVDVYLQDGSILSLFDAASFNSDTMPWPDSRGSYSSGKQPPDKQRLRPDNNMMYYFWIRRTGPSGAVTYPVSFSKIKEIDFTGYYGGSPDNPPATATLVTKDGEEDVVIRRQENQDDRFCGYFGTREQAVPFFTHATITLTDGKSFDVFVKTDGFLGGIDQAFGTYAMLWLQYDGIKKIEFLHDGSCSRCPECGAIFYDNDLKECPFDGTPLIKSGGGRQ